MLEQTTHRNPLPWRDYLTRIRNSDDFAAVMDHFVPLPIEFNRFSPRHSGALMLEEVLRDSQTVILLGAPGAGKTTAARALFLNNADRSDGNPIPLFVKLSDWGAFSISEDVPWQKEFIGAIASAISLPLLAKPPDADLSAALLRDFTRLSFLLIFDGLDEIRDSTVRLHLAKCMAQFAANHRSIQILVTMRKYSFTEEISGALPFEAVEFAKVDDDSKARIIERYAPPGSSVQSLLETIHSDLRLSRLSEIPMLLRIFAEHGSATTARSRGALFKLHVERRIAERFTESERPLIHDLLTAFAEQIRSRYPNDLPVIDSAALDDYPDATLLVQRMIEVSKNTFSAPTSNSFLDRLLRTRLIEVRDRPPSRCVGFSLPQYEDYYLARKVALDLHGRLKPTSPSVIHESIYITNREWHDVVVFSAGLLERQAIERLVPELKGDSHLFLRGWILGEVHAPEAEKLFVRECTSRIAAALNLILERISAWCLGILTIWVISLVPITFLYNHLWSWNWWIALLIFATYLAAVPLGVRWLYRTLVQRYCTRVQKRLPIELTALSCLQSTAVDLALRQVSFLIARKYAPPRFTRDHSSFDPVSDIVNFAQGQIQRCRDLVSSDTESILAQIEEDPDLIDHYVHLPSQGFSTKDFEIVSRYIFSLNGDLAIKLKLLRTLGNVATQNQELRRNIEEFMAAIIGASDIPEELRRRAQNILHSLSQRSHSVILLSADLRAILRSGPLRRFLMFSAVNLAGMVTVLVWFVDGKTVFEKCKNAWPLYVGWCAVLAMLGRVYLPRDIRVRLGKLWGTAESGRRRAQD